MRPAPETLPPPAPPPLPRKAFSIGAAIGHTFSVWWRHVIVFSLLTLAADLPILLVSLASGAPVPGITAPNANPFDRAAMAAQAAHPLPRGYWLAYAVTLLLFFVEAGAITHGVIHHLAGKPVSLRAMVATGVRRLVPLLVVGLLCYLMIVLGVVLLVVPGLFLGCALSAAVPAVVVERPGVLGAIRRSFALTKGTRFAIFVAFLVVTAVMFTAMVFGSFVIPALTPTSARTAGVLLGFVVNVVCGTLMWVLPGVLYQDLRVSKEGVDVVQLAAVFE